MDPLKLVSATAVGLVLLSCSENNPSDAPTNPLSITSSAIDTLTAVDSLWVRTDSIVWIYNTSGFSTASVVVKGTTNASSVGIETHGDGRISTQTVGLDSNGAFSDTVSIGFSHVSGVYITFNTKIILISENGDTAEIVVLNPKQ